MKNGSSRKVMSVRSSRKGRSDFSGWIAFLDIYAFGSHLESSFFSGAETKLLEMHRQLRLNQAFKGNDSYFMFSDSIVLWSKATKGDDAALKKFVERISITQRIASESDFLFRGSLAYGRILISQNYILGDAYLRAYKFESEKLVRPQIVIPKDEFLRAGLLTMFETELRNVEIKGNKTDQAMLLRYAPWEKVKALKNANIAAIQSSDQLTDEEKSKLVGRWNLFIEDRWDDGR
jgi:hypothetical protein